jgi:hypothetical protein
MNAPALQNLPPLKPGDDVLAVFTPLPSRRPVLRAVRIRRVFVSTGGTIRWEGVASKPPAGTRELVQGDRRQCIRLDALENLPAALASVRHSSDAPAVSTAGIQQP